MRFHLLMPITCILLAVSFVHADDLLTQGDKLVAGHRYEQAEAAYRKALATATGEDAVRCQYQIGYCLMRRYQCDEAIKAFDKALALPAINTDLRGKALIDIGYCHHHLRRFKKAIEFYQKAQSVEGATPESVVNAKVRSGYAWGKLDQPDKAVESFISMTTVEGVNPFWHQKGFVNAGTTRQKQRRYEEAAEYYRKALALGEYGHAVKEARNRLNECLAARDADAGFFIAPYVTLVSPTEATIFWVSRDSVSPGTVTISGGGQSITATASTTRMVDRELYRQSAKIEGLKPYTLYEYTIKSGDSSADGAFHTARDKPGPIRFVTLGDTQGGPEYHEPLAKLIAAENPDFVLHVGDCVELGQRWDEWKIQMFDPGRPYLSKAPIWVARGNHDGGPYFRLLFGYEDQAWKSFTFGDLHVMILNSTFYMGTRSGTKQLEWLRQQFEASTSLWSLVALHHSLFHTANGDTLVGQDNFRPLIESASPDLVFNGHYHKYSRQVPIGEPGKKPLINVVTGGGGGGNNTPSTTSPLVAAVYQSFHYCVIEIEDRTLTLTAKDIQGNVIDRFTLTKNEAGLFQDEVMAKAAAPDVARAVRLVYNDLKAPNYNRVDYTGVFADGKVTLDRNILKFDTLPANSKLVVEADEETAWSVKRQSLDLNAGELTFVATPPADAPKAPLAIVVTLEVDGHLFEPCRFPVTLR